MLTFSFLWKIKNKALIFSVLTLLLTACGQSGGGGGEPSVDPGKPGPAEPVEPVAIVDPDEVFTSIGVTSLDELKVKLEDVGLINVIAQITSENPDVQAEKVVRLLHQNNRNLEYDKIVKKEVPVAVVEKLKHLRMSPASVEEMVKLPDFSLLPKQDVSSEALDIYNHLKRQELNRKLNLSGQNALSDEEFIQLQGAFSQVEIVDNFGNTDIQLQNLIRKTSPGQSTAQSVGQSSAQVYKTQAAGDQPIGLNTPALPDGYYYENPVNEEQEYTLDSEYPFTQSSCYIRADFNEYPRAISKQSEEIDDGFISHDSGNALVHFPQSGIAVIRIDQDMTLNISKADGSSLVNQSVTAGQYVYLPVQQSDICDAYTFANVSNSYDINLLAMVVPERLYTRVFLDNKQYLTPSIETELINHNHFFNPASYTFASFDSALTEFEFLFSSDSSAAFDILVYAPSGKVYSSANNTFANRTEGHSGYYGLAGFADESIEREAGIWRFDLLPAGSIDVSNQQLQALKTVSMPDSSQQQNKETLTLTSLVNTDNDINHKEFVLGTVKTISFNTEGEDGYRNPGEVNVTLNTVMAPPLDVPDTLQHLIDENSGKLEDRIALWQCWEKSEKTGFELEPGNACNAFRGPYDTMQTSFEDAAYYSNHEYDDISGRWFRRTEPCSQLHYEQGHAINGFMCEKGIGEPYDYLPEGAAPDDYKVRYVLNYHAKLMRSIYAGESFLYTLSRHYDLYTNWVSRAIQVSTSTYPNNRINYKTYEYIYCNPDIPCEPASSYSFTFHNAAILEANKPIFGVPVERMVESTVPITFDYAASDEDEYNDDAALFAVLEYVAVQTFNLVNGNFIGMICDSVGLVDDLHQLELDAEADPLGSARMSINRYSTSDPFYGLHNHRNLEFYMSGLPEENTKIDTHGQRIKYAQLACSLSGLAASGTNFAANADTLLNLDYGKLSSLEDMTSAIQAMAILENSTNMAENAEEIATHIRNGDFESAKNLLKIDNNVNSLVSGTDMYSSTDVLLDSYINDGSAANGNNVVKSHVQFLKGGERKTRANLNFERVTSIPAQRIKVTLNKVEIIANKEDKDNSDDAEIIFEPYVGEVNDSDYNSHPYEPHGVMDTWFNNGEGIANLKYSNVKDGQTLAPETVIYNNYFNRNAAALYIELAILEDDGNSVESDDMVGVFSQTLKLEELFNQGQFSWTHTGGRDYQLVIDEFPVYNDKNQRVLENPLDPNYEQQKYHNRHRSPSALVTLTVDVTLNESTSDYPAVYTGLNPSPVDEGKDTYSMEMSVVNSTALEGIVKPQVFDTLNGHVIVSSEASHGIEGSFIAIDPATDAMTKLFDYNLDDLSGDLLPIKEALTSLKSIVPKGTLSDGGRKRYLPLFKLLPNNRLLFVITTDAGAKIIVASYTNEGVMSLVSSYDIKQEAQTGGDNVYTLLKAKLSPNRQGLLVPYVPESYKGSDKTEVVHPRVAYYTLGQDNNVHYHSTLLEPEETVQEVDFIGNEAVAVKSVDIRYIDESTHIWKRWFVDFEKNFQNSCNTELLNCYYAYYGATVSIYNIVETQSTAHSLLLTESIEEPYHVTTYPNGDPSLEYRLYSTLGQNLFSKKIIRLKTIVGMDSRALLRSNRVYYQLHYSDESSSYSYTGKSIFSGSKELHFNPAGQYFCADGVVCSGYLREAMKPTRNNPNTFTSDVSVNNFKFVDIERDLLAGITYDFNQTPAQPELSLLSLYNGAAYKGPHILDKPGAEILNTTLVSSGADNVAGLVFDFVVTDRDTRIDQLSVEVEATTLATTVAPAQTGGHVYTAQCTVDPDASSDAASVTGKHVANCSGVILANFYNADLSQQVDITVSDGIYTNTKSFTLKVEREAPLLSDITYAATIQDINSYNPISIDIDSQSASTYVSGCSGSEKCYLLHNGYVDNWVIDNPPSWLSYNNVAKDYGHNALHISGIPPMGGAAVYTIPIKAIQNTSSGEVETMMTLTITAQAPDVTVDPFSFNQKVDQSLDMLVQSNEVVLTGFNQPVALTVEGGAYSLDNNTWSTDATTVSNNQSVWVRHTTSANFESTNTTTLTVGDKSANFVSTTMADIPLLDSPYINGYVSCSIDDNQCDYTFTDDSAWRSAITEVTLSNYGSGGDAQVLTSPDDYIISEGQLRLLINANNNMVKQSGDWEIVVKALNYHDSQTNIRIDAGAISVGAVTVSPAFEAGITSTVTAQITNRFGFGEAYQSLNAGLIPLNSDSSLNEVYRYSGGGSGFVWKKFNSDMSQNVLSSDENGGVNFQVKLPGCIDAHDGFTLKVGTNSDIIYTNSDGDCTDSEWTNRYKYGVKYSEVGPAGNVYSVFEANGLFDDEYAALGNKDIYVLKQDRNGEKLWLKQVGTSEYDLAINIQVDNSGVYLAGLTNGDLDGDSLDEFTNTGGAFILHMDSVGNQTWLKRVVVNDGDTITAMTLADSKLHYILHGSSDGNSIIQRDLTGENPVEKVSADAFAGSDSITYSQLQRDISGSYYAVTNRRLRDSNNVFSNYHRVHKFDSSGVLVAQSIFLPKESGIVNLVVTDSIAYISMTTSVAIVGNGFENEVLNQDGHSAVRVAALRTDDLSIKWTRLIQSNDQYGQDSIAAGLQLAGNILYAGASTSGELYYNSSLLTTPAATVNLVALHAGDGSELAHKSWLTDPNFNPDDDYGNGLLHLVRNMSIGPNNSLFFTGWIKLNFNQTTYTNANGIESYVLKAQLPATASTLPSEPLGLSRNAYSEIVTDHEHELQWDDRFESNNSSANWTNANSACSGSEYNGGGWRLPTDLEVERTGYIPVTGSVFDRVDPFGLDNPDYQVDPDAIYYYWTSTEGSDSGWHAAIEFGGPGDSFLNDTNHNYRCVRDM